MDKIVNIFGVVALLIVCVVGFQVNPAEAGHIACGDTVGPGTIMLDSNIGPCSDDGIIVVSKTTVDGNGFAITGPGRTVAGSVGIDLTGRTNVRVKNVAIDSFEIGILIENSGAKGYNKIETSRIVLFKFGVHVSNSRKNEIEDNHILGDFASVALRDGSDHNKLKRNQLRDIRTNGTTTTLSADTTSTPNTYEDNICHNPLGTVPATACVAPK